MSKVTFEIIKEIAVLQEGKNSWQKELNLISWNGSEPKFDVRWWAFDRLSIGKGITFAPEELYALANIVHSLPKNFHEV